MSAPVARRGSSKRSRRGFAYPPSTPPILPKPAAAFSLALVPVSTLRPTEGADPVRVDQLRRQIGADGYLNEPLDTVGTKTLLNGHTRRKAAGALGCRHLLVLDHPPADVTCATWSILNRYPVTGGERWRGAIEMHFDEFLGARDSLPFATSILALEDGICRVFPQDKVLKETLIRQNDLYQVFARTTNGQPIERFPDNDFPPALNLCRQKFGAAGEILLYPAFSPERILEVAEAGLKVAPGATRFGFPFRVTNLRMPLWLLRSSESTERKNERLQAVLRAHPLTSFDGETLIPQGLDATAYQEV
jgi:hypothetical protein